jgi:hypothetical protein
MPSSVDEQPPSRPDRPRPQPPRRRPAGRSRAAAPARAGAPRRRQPPPAPSRRRPPVEEDYDEGANEGPDEGANEGGAPEPARSPNRRSQKRMVVLLSVLTAVVVIVGGLAIVLTSGKTKDNGPAPASPDTPAPLTTFHDAETGFTVQYPRAWRKVDVPVAEYRLAVDGGSNVAFTIRVVPIQTPATTANLENFKAVTDGLVGSNATVNVLKQQAVTLNGMLGYYYFYTFSDGPVQAVHAHYFLFSGNKMNIIVFQSLPDDFQNLAATFDKIAESFRSDPNVPPTSTSVAPATSTTAR